MRFEFATATRIIFGEGTLNEVGPVAARMGRKALVVNGLSEPGAEPLIKILGNSGIETWLFQVTQEPTIDLIKQGVDQARKEACDLVIGFGGGSAVDSGKAIAVLITNPGEPLDYLEVVGRGRPLENPPLPYIAIPTTAGTGAEVTRNAVLGVPEKQVKVSLRSPLMLPRLAIVDPELTYNLPKAVTASTGLDALTQLIESYVTIQSNPLTDGICREGLKRAGRSLQRAFEQGDDHAARRDMALASLIGGLALANAKLGAVHGFAGPLGGMFPAPHGAVCARLLPFVMEINVRALNQRAQESAALDRYDEVAQILTNRRDAKAKEGVAWVQSLCADLNVPGLSTYGVARNHFSELIDKSMQASSMKGNPIQLTEQEMDEILSRAL
jgi:alcohol dehydrogenase class IV